MESGIGRPWPSSRGNYHGGQGGQRQRWSQQQCKGTGQTARRGHWWWAKWRRRGSQPGAREKPCIPTPPCLTRTHAHAFLRPLLLSVQRVAFRGSPRGDLLTPAARADLLQFQVYVRQRLGELNQRMPPRMPLRERAELAFLEEEVIQDHMNRRRRQLRDPLKDVPLHDIRHTNLNLLSRFVSEAGAILPRKLTGVKPRKQRRIARMLKRSQQLALLPKTWKHPKFRHATYADQISQPERNVSARYHHFPLPPYASASMSLWRAKHTRPATSLLCKASPPTFACTCACHSPSPAGMIAAASARR